MREELKDECISKLLSLLQGLHKLNLTTRDLDPLLLQLPPEGSFTHALNNAVTEIPYTFTAIDRISRLTLECPHRVLRLPRPSLGLRMCDMGPEEQYQALITKHMFQELAQRLHKICDGESNFGNIQRLILVCGTYHELPSLSLRPLLVQIRSFFKCVLTFPWLGGAKDIWVTESVEITGEIWQIGFDIVPGLPAATGKIMRKNV